MALSIRTNIASLNAQRNLSTSQGVADNAMARLSSGMRITKAGDDAAGLAISSKLQANIRSANQAARNANDGLSLIQTTEQAMNSVTNILTRLRELATQAANDAVGTEGRAHIKTEADELVDELDRVAGGTNFNGTKLLDGSATTLTFQVGADADADSQISVDLTNVKTDATTLGVNALAFATAANGQTSMTAIDGALDDVAGFRATLGAVGNRLQMAIENVQTYAESLSAANSRIRDVDVAEESANLARANVLQQAGISVLAQANQSPQMALKLLG
jgi:flagellin